MQSKGIINDLPSESEKSLASAEVPWELSLVLLGLDVADPPSSSSFMILRIEDGSHPSLPSTFTYHMSRGYIKILEWESMFYTVFSKKWVAIIVDFEINFFLWSHLAVCCQWRRPVVPHKRLAHQGPDGSNLGWRCNSPPLQTPPCCLNWECPHHLGGRWRCVTEAWRRKPLDQGSFKIDQSINLILFPCHNQPIKGYKFESSEPQSSRMFISFNNSRYLSCLATSSEWFLYAGSMRLN